MPDLSCIKLIIGIPVQRDICGCTNWLYETYPWISYTLWHMLIHNLGCNNLHWSIVLCLFACISKSCILN